MRGKRRSRNTREYMVLRNSSIFIFVIIFILVGTGYALLNTKIEIQGKATLIADDPSKPVEPGFSVASLKTMNNWGQGGIVIITVTNNDNDYDEWEFCFEAPKGTTDVIVHNNSYIYGCIYTFEENKVTIKMNKVNEDGSTNWMAPWEKGTKKDIQIQFTFDTSIDNISLKNVILNNKLITSELTETVELTPENEELETNVTEDVVNTNVVEETDNVINNVQNDDLTNDVVENENVVQEDSIEDIVEQDSTNLVNQNNIE